MYEASRERLEKLVNLLLFCGKAKKRRYHSSVFFLGTSTPDEIQVALYAKQCHLESFDIALLKQVFRSKGFVMRNCIRHTPHIWQGWFIET